MKAIPFQEQNTIFTKPKGMSDEECGSLHTYRGEGQIISCWELEPGDIERLKKDGKVWLIVVGNGHPPVCLTTEKPFTPIEAEPEEPEVRCRDCGYLSNIDEDDGMVLQCELSSQTVFLDDLSFTCMSRCPLVLERGRW